MSEATTYLELRDLRVSYGKVEALHGISVHVEQGEIVTILGANGAGKTTTLTTISGLRKPSGGSILFQGRPLHTIPSHEIVRLGITQSPEGRRVFGTLSVRENLDLGAFTSKDRGRFRQDTEMDIRPLPPPRGTGRAACRNPLPAANSRCSPSPARSWPTPMCCSSTSRPSACAAAGAARSSTRAQDQPPAVTVILVEQNARAALKLASRGYVIEVGRVVMEDASEALLANPDVQAAYLGGGQENGQEN